MKIRISGEMDAPSTEELSAEASAYIAGMYKLAEIVKPRLLAIIPEPAFLFTSSGNSFFAYTEMDHTKIGDGRLEPALCSRVICPHKDSFYIASDGVIEFDGCRAQVEHGPNRSVIGTFGFTSDELYNLDSLVDRFRTVLKGMLLYGAWGGPQELRHSPLLTAPQQEALFLS